MSAETNIIECLEAIRDELRRSNAVSTIGQTRWPDHSTASGSVAELSVLLDQLHSLTVEVEKLSGH